MGPAPFGFIHKIVPQGHKNELTPAQRRMYASEKQMNFRTIAKLCATRSNYVLRSSDLASAELHAEITELGQFAELAYAVLDPTFIFSHLDILSRSGFPLEGYDALQGTTPVSSFHGRTGNLPGYVAYRAVTRQLIVAFSGTASFVQALYDLRFAKHTHPAGNGCAVHSGFWKIYKGCRTPALEGIKKGLQEHDVQEVVVTGHSLGGAVSFLLALDLMLDGRLPPHIGLKAVGFGSPRVGNKKMVQLWKHTLELEREKGRDVHEYLVKAYNDGVPALPPMRFGYRHFTTNPVYFCHGRLFHIPPSESEHGVFDVEEDASWNDQPPPHPRGGHNYYNGRDLEAMSRRMQWIEEMMGGDTEKEWESKYMARIAKDENKWKEKQNNP